MATTENGTHYPSDYSSVADVPRDMKKMAESIDANKVQKIPGKGLSTNDFTNEYKQKLEDLENYDDTEVKKDISDIKEEQETQNEKINTSITKNEVQDELISKLKSALINVETEEAKSLHVTDANKFGQLEVLGNQEQETRSGKNLLNLRTQSVNGITTTKNTDGTLNIKGTATANGNIGFLNKNIILEANKSYTFSMKKISGQNFNNSVWFWNTTDSNSEITINLNNNTKTVTYDHEVTINAVNMTVNAGNVFDVNLALQVEEGTVATEYEQYGASPSPNYPSKVKCLGNNKNLYNEETIEMNKYLDGDTGVVGASTVSKISDYIELTEKEYTINYTNDINTRGYSFYDADKKFISGKDSNKAPYTITKPDNAKYIRFAVPLDALDVKIEEGTEATSYSPYRTR